MKILFMATRATANIRTSKGAPVTLFKNQQGLSLVELIVALGLSSVLLLGLFQIFTSNQQAFNLQDGVARVQESGRITMEMLSRSTRSSDFLGCASGDATSPFTNSVDQTQYDEAAFQNELVRYDGTNGITGFNDVTGAITVLNNMGLQVGTGAQQIVEGTDAFILHSAEACAGNGVTVGEVDSIDITDAAACGIAQHDVVIVSSCGRAEMFAVTSDLSTDELTHGDSHNDGANFADGAYPSAGSYIYLPTVTAFHVGFTATGDRALFMTQLSRNGEATAFVTQEITDGVEDMQVLYGEDTDDDGSVNRYVDAGVVTDFENVLSVKTRLLVRSQDNTTSVNQTYTFNGANITATDLRYRVPYETTNTIRNRLK